MWADGRAAVATAPAVRGGPLTALPVTAYLVPRWFQRTPIHPLSGDLCRYSSRRKYLFVRARSLKDRGPELREGELGGKQLLLRGQHGEVRRVAGIVLKPREYAYSRSAVTSRPCAASCSGVLTRVISAFSTSEKAFWIEAS